MGAGIAGEALKNAEVVLWCSAGRSEATKERAAKIGLTEVTTIRDLVYQSEIILSICPPNVALSVALDVAKFDLKGQIFLEANPLATAQLAEMAGPLASAQLVDGAIVGSVVERGEPILYLAGPVSAADALKALFINTRISVNYLGPDIGQASILKLAYSIFQKGSRVLTALSHALVGSPTLSAELVALGKQRSGSYLSELNYLPELASLAWRWAPELTSAADQLKAKGLPNDGIQGLADTLLHWDSCAGKELSIEEVLKVLGNTNIQ
jgi:3-hydroxyisobutyrate dehydrogenase-like beta-hydroxyacid dehydrogenase